MRTVVVLPEPFGPRNAKSLPSGMERSMPSTALMSWAKCLTSSRATIAAIDSSWVSVANHRFLENDREAAIGEKSGAYAKSGGPPRLQALGLARAYASTRWSRPFTANSRLTARG